MISVPLKEDGPDMDIVMDLVRKDASIKGIWCVPLHSNPQGVCYSDHVVDQLASMETAADDFRIFWDNAYGIHHIYEEVPLKDILKACMDAGHPERAYYFFSTSKIKLSRRRNRTNRFRAGKHKRTEKAYVGTDHRT